MTEFINILGIFSLIFGFWPLIVLAPLNWRRDNLLGMIYVWGFFAVFRVLFIFFSITPSKLVIDEPLNTYIFILAGGILFSIYFLRKKISNGRNSTKRKEPTTGISPQQFMLTNSVSTSPKFIPLCPKCGHKMVFRTAKKGVNAGKKFWGCSRYPECNGTVKIAE
jgi:hypothetical protein